MTNPLGESFKVSLYILPTNSNENCYFYTGKVKVLVTQSRLTLFDPTHYSPQAPLSLEFSSHSLLQGIFQTERSNPGLLHCKQILYHLSHQGRWLEDIVKMRGFCSLLVWCLNLTNNTSSSDKVNITSIGTNWQYVPPNVVNWEKKYHLSEVQNLHLILRKHENQIWGSFYITAGLSSSKMSLSHTHKKKTWGFSD